MGLSFSSRSNESIIDIMKLSNCEIIVKFNEILKPLISFNSDKEKLDIFTNFIKSIIKDYENRLEWSIIYHKKFKHYQEIDNETIEALKLFIEKQNCELKLKQIEIDKLNKNISKKNYNKIKSLKRKNICKINNNLKCHPRKIRRLNINFKKDINNFENKFKIEKPEFYSRIKNFENSRNV
jgi:hypothetical protein